LDQHYFYLKFCWQLLPALYYITAPNSSKKDKKMSLMYYFLYCRFSYLEGLLIFVFGFLFLEQKAIPIYFSELYYFQFRIFIFKIKNIFEILKLCWVQV